MFRIQDLDCRAQGLRLRVECANFCIHYSEFRVMGVGCRGLGCRVEGVGFRV